MRFESKGQREELILSFEAKAKEIEAEKKANPKTDKNYNCRVIMDTRTEWDGDEQETGEIYVFYIKQPSLFDSIKILDGGEQGKFYGKLLLAWGAMVMENESSPEIRTDRIKLGYLPKMLGHIDALMGDQKKS